MSTQAAGKDEKTIKGVDLDAKRIKDRFAAAGCAFLGGVRVSSQRIGMLSLRLKRCVTAAA